MTIFYILRTVAIVDTIYVALTGFIGYLTGYLPSITFSYSNRSYLLHLRIRINNISFFKTDISLKTFRNIAIYKLDSKNSR